MAQETHALWGFWRIALLIVFSLCLLWGVLPLVASRIHAGCVALMLGGVVGMASCVWWPLVAAWWKKWWATGFGRVVLVTVTTLIVALFLLFTVVSVMMIVAACRPAPPNATVIVLGAGLRDGEPSRTLRTRLGAAAAYLIEHPESNCVLSGGQGPDEPCTEASVMKAYLLKKGIAEERLYIEDRSTSTFENLQFSRKIIQENGLCEAVAVVTQEFHQFRAQAFAKQQGFTQVGAITAHSSWDLLPSYWIRDFAGICHMVLLGT